MFIEGTQISIFLLEEEHAGLLLIKRLDRAEIVSYKHFAANGASLIGR